MAEPIRILFLCTGNSARSIMAESIANHLFTGRIEAISAGSDPKDSPHPLALETLRRHGLSTDFLYSKSVDEIVGHDVDLVVTLCDLAASGSCPTPLAGVPRRHWGFPDPPTQPDPDAAFDAVYRGLVAAMEEFLA
ncbi:MAG: arsenate reductase ArsC [Phycisphaerales bacterium]|nr:arsenate reductase ArsC [Phycisphaerales bacterium]